MWEQVAKHWAGRVPSALVAAESALAEGLVFCIREEEFVSGVEPVLPADAKVLPALLAV